MKKKPSPAPSKSKDEQGDKEPGHYRWYLEPRSEAANKSIGHMLADVGEGDVSEGKITTCYDGRKRSLWEVRNFADVERFINSEHDFHIYRQPSGGESLPHRYRPSKKSDKDKPIKTAAQLL